MCYGSIYKPCLNDKITVMDDWINAWDWRWWGEGYVCDYEEKSLWTCVINGVELHTHYIPMAIACF